MHSTIGHLPPMIALAATLALTACTPPPPSGLVVPDVSDVASLPGETPEDPAEAERAVRELAKAVADRPLVSLRITLPDPPEELLAEQDAGVLVLSREGERAPLRLVFVNDALSAYTLAPGIYRMETIAGYDCGALFLTVTPGAGPVTLGGLELQTFGEETAALSGSLPTPADLDRLAELSGIAREEIDARPLERRANIPCSRVPRAVARPDIDPTVRVLTPLEVAGVVVLGGLLGAAVGAAAATGSIVFVSGSATGGVLSLGL